MKCLSSLNRRMTGWMKCLSSWMTGQIQGKLLSLTSSLYLALLRGDRLRHQYIMDVYVAIEQNCLKYLRLNQKKLHADLYQGLQDTITTCDNSVAAIEQKIILPSSFTVGPRHMVQNIKMPWQSADESAARMRLLHSLAIPNGLKSRKCSYSDNNLRIDPIW